VPVGGAVMPLKITKKAQLRAPLSLSKQSGPVLTLIYIVAGHPHQAPILRKLATARSLYSTGALCHIPGARMVCSAFHFIKAVVSQKKTALLMKP